MATKLDPVPDTAINALETASDTIETVISKVFEENGAVPPSLDYGPFALPGELGDLLIEDAYIPSAEADMDFPAELPVPEDLAGGYPPIDLPNPIDLVGGILPIDLPDPNETNGISGTGVDDTDLFG